MSPWEDVEADPEFATLAPKDKAALFDDWHKNTVEQFHKELDPEQIDSAGMRGFLASGQAKRRQLLGEQVTPEQAVKEFDQGLKSRSQSQQKALKDYDELENASFKLKDAEAGRNAAMFSDTYLGEGAKILDSNIGAQQQNLEAVRSRFAPGIEQQAKEAREAIRGERPVAVLDGDIYTDPALTLDKEEYRKAIQATDAPAESKLLALADFNNRREQFVKGALRTFNVAGESPVPGMTSFPKWESEQPAEVRAKPQQDKVLDYLRAMKDRSGFRKLVSAAGTGAIQGGADVANQGIGLAAMATGSDDLAKHAGEVEKGTQALSDVQKLEGDNTATGATTVGGISRLGVGMAPAIGAGLATGGSLPVAALAAGAQTAGAQYPTTYNEMIRQGKTPEEAVRASRGAALLSGGITTALTAIGGTNGVEALLRKGGMAAVRDKMKSVLLVGPLKEIAEELPDELSSQIIESSLTNPDKPVSQVVDEFMAKAPDLALQVGILGGAGEMFSKNGAPAAVPTPAEQQRTPVNSAGLGRTVAEVVAEADALNVDAHQTAVESDSPLLAQAIAQNAAVPAPEAQVEETGETTEPSFEQGPGAADKTTETLSDTEVNKEPANDAEAAKTKEFTQAEIDAKKKIGEGSESEVYDDGDTVLKVAESYNQAETLADRVEYALRAEKLLGNLSGLRYAGFRRGRNGVLNPVFSQRNLDGPSASKAQIRDLFRDHGWTENSDGTFSIDTDAGRVSTLSDLYDGGNVIVVDNKVIPRDVATIIEAIPTTETATPREQGGSNQHAGESRTPAEGSISDVTTEKVPDNKSLSTITGTVTLDPEQLSALTPNPAEIEQAFSDNEQPQRQAMDLNKAGPIMVIRQKDGALRVVQGHHRLARALRDKVPLKVDIQNEVSTKPAVPTKSIPERINESSLSPRTTYPSLVQDIKNLTGNTPAQLQEVADALLPEPMTRPTAEKIARRLMDENQSEREANATRDRHLEREMLGEEKQQRGEEKPVSDNKAPLTQGEFVTWQDENGIMREGVLTKANAGKNNLGEPMSEVTMENSEVVQVPRRELQPVMASKRNPAQVARDEAIKSIRGTLGTELSTGVSAVDAINGATELQGQVPGVQKAWIGTRADFLADEKLGKAFPQVRRALESGAGERLEGLFAAGRAFVFTDQVGIFEADAAAAQEQNIPPAQAAVQRVIVHEALVHRGFYALDPATRRALFQWGAQNIYEAEMDAKAEEYGHGANWRTDVASREWLMEEIMAKMIERLKAPPKSGPLKQLWDILAALWRKITGRSRDVTLRDIQDVAKLLRTALELAENNVETRSGMPIRVDVANKSLRPHYTSPLDQTLANTAKALRLMRDGPPAVPVNLQQVYQATIPGKPSAMVSLDDLFATAKQVHPELTEAEFGRQLQALYDDNGAYVEPAESPAVMRESADKYNVRSSQGIPATFAMVLDTDPVRASMRSEQDAEYMQAVKDGDVAKQQAMVDTARLLPRQSFYKGDVEIIRNPSDADYRELNAAYRKEYPFDRSGDPTTRFTTDANGNRWIWRSDLGIHNQIEPFISNKEGKTVGQNEANWNPDASEPVVKDRDGNIIPLSQRFNTASDDIRFSLRPEVAERLARQVQEAQEASGDITESEQAPIKDRPVHTFAQQSGEARVQAAVQIVDALESENVPKEEWVDEITSPAMLRQLGIDRDPDMLSVLLAEAMRRGAPGAFSAYEVTRERAGRALGTGAMLHSHPRYQHLFVLNGIKKEHQQQATDIAEANADIKADEVKKLDAEASQTAAKEMAESAEDAAFRAGEESLSAGEKTLWQKAKDLITRLGAIVRIRAAKNAGEAKQSLRGTITQADLDALAKMTPEQLDAEEKRVRGELRSVLKGLTGTKDSKGGTKANAQAGRIATLVSKLSDQLGVPTDITTAVEALTASQDNLRNQFEQGIVNSLVGKVRSAITPKLKPSKNLNSVIRQVTRILADNLNLPTNTTSQESLGEKAIDAFGRVRNNEQLIREAWEKAREQIRATLAKRATEGLEGLTEEEAADIEQQMDEQLASIAAEVPAHLWARGQAFSVLRDALAETKFDNNAQILANPEEALKAAQGKINEAVEKVGNVDPARWASNQSYIIAAFNQLVADLRAAKAKSDSRRRATQRAGVFSPAETQTFNRLMDSARKRAGDKTPLLPENVSWGKLFSSSPQSQETKAKAMMDYMKADPVLSNLTAAEQQELADMFAKQWGAKRTALTEAKVAAVLKRRHATEKGKEAVKGAIPKFIQAINRGELTNDIIAQEIAQKFGFEKLTDAENKKLETLAKELQEPNIPVHERRAKTDEIVKIIARKTGLSTAEILSAWWVTSVLSGPRTIFTIGMAFLSGGFEVFTHALATVVNAHLQGRRSEGTAAAMQSITNYFKSYPRPVQLAWQYVRTGDKNLLADSDPAFMQFFDTGRNNPQSIGWRRTQSKNKATRVLGRFMHFFERMLTAGDLFNSTTTRHGMLPVAQFLNSKTYEKARVADETDLSSYRKKALNQWWGGKEPKTAQEQALVTRQSIDLMETVLAKYANVLEDANFVAAQGAMTLNPEGVGGKAYRAIRGIANRAEMSSAKAVKAADKLKAEQVGAYNKKTQQAIAFLYHFATHQMLNVAGLRFARFASNKLNQSIGFIPLLGLARLYEKDYAGQIKSQAIIKNQVIGAVVAMAGIVILKAISDEPDDDKRGWGIEGSWSGLSAAKIKQLMAAGRKQNSIHFGEHTFNYSNWPISSVLAAIGAMADRIKYDPEDWKKASTAEVSYTGLWAAMSSTFDTTALSQLSEILGSNVHSRDPVDASMKKVSRVFGNFAGGFIPRVFKDIDLMGDGKLRKYEGWENFAKEVPYYRRYVGGPLLDIFGRQVDVSRTPWSREYQAQPEAKEYRLLGQLGSNGLWMTPADPANRRVGRGKRSREMTDAEQKRFVSIVGENYRQLVLKHGDRLVKMPHEAAKDLLGKLTAQARDRAERAALVTPQQ